MGSRGPGDRTHPAPTRPPRAAHLCGHQRAVPGCGGCDPGAVAAVMDDGRPGVWRAPQPGDFVPPALRRPVRAAHPCGHQRSVPGCGGCDPEVQRKVAGRGQWARDEVLAHLLVKADEWRRLAGVPGARLVAQALRRAAHELDHPACEDITVGHLDEWEQGLHRG